MLVVLSPPTYVRPVFVFFNIWDSSSKEGIALFPLVLHYVLESEAMEALSLIYVTNAYAVVWALLNHQAVQD